MRQVQRSHAQSTFHDITLSKLDAISAAVGENATADTARSLVTSALAGWGHRPIGRVPRWPSWASDDHSPVELSLAFRGERVALRVAFEPQGDVATLESQWDAGWAWMNRLEAEHSVSCDKLRRVADLFRPNHRQLHRLTQQWDPDPSGLRRSRLDLTPQPGLVEQSPGPAGGDADFAFGFGFGVEGQRSEHRVYLNARAHGDEAAPTTVRQTLERLGLGSAWTWISEVGLRRPTDQLLFLSLDLGGGPARVKIYVAHSDCVPDDIERVLACTPGYCPGIGAGFCRNLAGTNGPYDRLPLVTYLAFTEGAGAAPSSATLQIRIRSYARDDAEALARISRLLDAGNRRIVTRAVSALADRPLDQRLGLIACASYSPPARPSDLTVYFATEMYEVAPPRPGEAPRL